LNKHPLHTKTIGKQTYSFRPITDSDRTFLLKLYGSTRADELALTGWTEDQKKEFLQQQFSAQHTYYQENFPHASFLIIQDGQTPVGRIYTDRRPDEIRLIDITLLPEYRGGGLGTALLEELITEAGEAGKPLRIHVEKFNPALRLYKRLGFSHIADTGVYFLMEWSPENSKDQ
jgi:ribosomal protein S18 acetylase RimI-like enzyme